MYILTCMYVHLVMRHVDHLFYLFSITFPPFPIPHTVLTGGGALSFSSKAQFLMVTRSSAQHLSSMLASRSSVQGKNSPTERHTVSLAGVRVGGPIVHMCISLCSAEVLWTSHQQNDCCLRIQLTQWLCALYLRVVLIPVHCMCIHCPLGQPHGQSLHKF